MMEKVKEFTNVISDEDCDLAIKTYTELSDIGKFDRVYDKRRLYRNPIEDVPRYLIDKYLPTIEEAYNTKFYVREVLLSIYEEGSSLDAHIDYEQTELVASLGALFYFNDNFDGGELYFVRDKYEYKPQKGSIVVFPCNNRNYKHGVRVITSGIRYAMPLELTENPNLSVPY